MKNNVGDELKMTNEEENGLGWGTLLQRWSIKFNKTEDEIVKDFDKILNNYMKHLPETVDMSEKEEDRLYFDIRRKLFNRYMGKKMLKYMNKIDKNVEQKMFKSTEENAKEELPANCGNCQFFYELREDKGLGICLQVKELREDCDCGDIVNNDCIPLLRLRHICRSCSYNFPTCTGKPKFTRDHPKVDDDWIILKDRDNVYECPVYITRW